MRKNLLLLKWIIFVFLFLMSTVNSIAQKRTTGCGYIIPPKQQRLMSNFQSVYEAKEILDKMLQTINWQENFRIQEKNGIQNAYATIINNMRWIVYDNNFLEDIDAYTKTKWSSISILAHEVGHHYYDHVVSSKGSTIPKEIEADAFSGYVMAKLGATKEQSIAAIQAIATDRASSTHPGKQDRVNAISSGWDKAGVNTSSPTTNPKPSTNTTPAPSQPKPSAPSNQQQADPENDPSWIALYIQSQKDEDVFLSDDGKNFQKATIKANEPFVFKFEIYQYGWLRLKYYNGYRTFKLNHGKDYAILWNRRTGNWTVSIISD
ncbi:MAG: hypothetical protein E6Q95_01260 [Chitinophagaceae bacterium]|nr:MAG: hypothetical protein E6Q95_01260 [Chitinophagaceae bacterium]